MLRFRPPFDQLPCPSPRLRASIIVPARDEERGVTQTLDALAASCDERQQTLDPRAWEVLLLCNNCRDHTASVARAWAKARPQLSVHVVEAHFEPSQANIGTVRRLLMDAACARLERVANDDAPRFIASTDADTRVEPTWLWENEREFRLGAGAVGGRILVENDGDARARKMYLFDTAYRLLAAQLESALDPHTGDPWPRHFQFFGASLCVSPRVYRAVGGLPKVTQLEDVALERELLRADVRVRRSPRVRVRTSARQSGRVACGLSTQMLEWQTLERAGGAWLVPSGEEIAHRTRLRRQLGAAFRGQTSQTKLDVLAHSLGLTVDELRARIAEANTFGALWDDVWNANSLRKQFKPVPVDVALEQMRGLLAAHSCSTRAPVSV